MEVSDTYQIKPIETEYKGYRFRSRLEAKWAVFYDLLFIKYESEPEGFVLSDGEYYLPDFYLPDLDTYVEIKGLNAFSIELHDGYIEPKEGRESPHKYIIAAKNIVDSGHNYLIAFGDPLDSIQHNSKNYLFYRSCCTPFLMKQIPEGHDCEKCDGKENIFSIETNPLFLKNKLIMNQTPEQLMKACPMHDSISFMIFDKDNDDPLTYFGTNEKEVHTAVINNIKFSKDARQARFEHGEKPNTTKSNNDSPFNT